MASDSSEKVLLPDGLPLRDRPSSSSSSLEPIDPSSERRLLWKVDRHLVPILFALFLAAFLDRINIGNARLQGLENDLGMDKDGPKFNIALFMFFIPYILLEVPSNIILKKIRPSLWLSSIMLGWGVITICQGFTQSFAGLVICRVLLGVFEAGFVPGAIYLLSTYYKRHELQLRVSVFFSASILAGAFSGLLAYAIAKMSGVGGYAGWRWIFIVEGSATVVLAAASYWLVPDWPETAKFLRPHERETLIRRLAEDAGAAKMNKWSKGTSRRIFGDVKIWLGAFMYLGIVNTGYGGSFFIPTILNQLGPAWTPVRSQVMSIPIYIVAAVLALATAFLTDRLKHRFAFIIVGCCVATIGYAILLSMTHVSVGVRYAALFLVTGGGYIAQPITLVWLNNNMGGHLKKGVSSAMQIGLGNCGGIIASNIYLPKQKPRYPVGFGVSLGLVGLCALSAIAFFVLIRIENKRRNGGQRDHRLDASPEELENLGDDHPSFRFTY
ncbi:hypothetical protein EPUS_04614 [Endocarpon pusillum Z07020]|uniref:Major facilitator superfamily (MFS) profile domain-containing protein n=1 Tax=Endocarpon pusillum (strain Z07020 / HMAS-L-300199) TaxID=1263415 RepID=U1I180_ENDPU|nr:uncharacterized protein EPUS_04614 [Endocarpon pusillum Z07020]ERF75634.1 hypothetical protein EPUS_04614 [Endocarpon pusillum Z07020]